jgi:NitT/TauT family transport system ATP-binding protein
MSGGPSSGLLDVSEANPRQFSGGVGQCVALACALAVDPALLPTEEPFAALDSSPRERMQRELVRAWQQEGKAVIVITHDIDQAIIIADRVAVMSRPGGIAAIMPLTSPRLRTTLDPDSVGVMQGVRRELHDASSRSARGRAEPGQRQSRPA